MKKAKKKKKDKLWSGRFKTGTASSTEKFTESISFDRRLWSYDIQGSIAHAKMLARQKIISVADSRRIIRGLEEIHQEISNGSFRFDTTLEDIHMNIEKALTNKIGLVGGKLHTARSRNDQIALDLRLYLKDEIKRINSLIRKFQRSLISVSKKNINTFMPGYTHLQRAQPVSLAQHLLAYVHMLQRDRDRLNDALKRTDVMPLGACAMAGTSLPIDRGYVAGLLGFKRISENSMDTVSDRDFIIEFLSASSVLMMHISRMSEELILWSSEEFSFIEISDEFTTGSSIMPQKKNPDVAELIRGKTGRVYGNLINLLTVMKALPLTYNRDMQEDKTPLFDTVDTVSGSLEILTEMFPNIKFNKERMELTASGGFSTATEIADYLVKGGVPFRTAHETVGKMVSYCISKKCDLNDIPFNILKKFSPVFRKDVYKIMSVGSAVEMKRSPGGTSPGEITKQIQRLSKAIR